MNSARALTVLMKRCVSMRLVSLNSTETRVWINETVCREEESLRVSALFSFVFPQLVFPHFVVKVPTFSKRKCKMWSPNVDPNPAYTSQTVCDGLMGTCWSNGTASPVIYTLEGPRVLSMS